MKVFISHSSKDKWAARRIAQEIETLTAKTFLDEKDIETGESIDNSIKEHLADSDHFLLLLSPASVKSEWVLLELGGALALGKTIIPILLYVGANEIPKAISLKLARDINDIQKYYDEISHKIGHIVPKSKLSKKAPPDKKHIRAKRKLRFKVGDRVRIIPQKPVTVTEAGLSFGWIDAMDSYLGLTARIIRITGYGDGYELDVDQGKHAWAEEWFVPDNEF